MTTNQQTSEAREYARRPDGRFGVQPVSEQPDGLDALDLAMSKSSAFERIERQLAYKRARLEELRRSDVWEPATDYFFAMDLGAIGDYNNDYTVLAQRLTESERENLRKYTALTYLPLNRYLTNPTQWEAEFVRVEDGDSVHERRRRLEDMAAHLDSALSKAPRRQRTLFRRLDQDTTREFTGSPEWAATLGFIPGETVTFRGFSSTTIDPGYIERTVQDDGELTSIVLVLTTDKGAPTDFTVENANDARFTQDREREILLPRGMTFTVDRVTRAEFGGGGEGPRTVLTVFLTESEVPVR